MCVGPLVRTHTVVWKVSAKANETWQISLIPDATLKPVLDGRGGISMVHVGSTAVRQAIEKYKPLTFPKSIG